MTLPDPLGLRRHAGDLLANRILPDLILGVMLGVGWANRRKNEVAATEEA